MMRYDIAIIGAGPAGSTLAREIALAKPSLRVLLIDAQKPDSGKVCGGLLSPDAQKMMASFGLTLPSSVLSESQIFAVDTIDLAAGIHRTYARNYLNMDRYAFDSYLLSLVPSSVEIVKGRCIAAAERDGGYSLKVNLPSGEAEFFADAVVGADGAPSLIRRTFFRDKAERTVAYQEWYVAREDSTIPPYSCIFDKKTSKHCSWTIRKGEYVILGGVFEKKGFREAFAEQKRRLEAFLGESFGEPSKTESCFVMNPKRRRDIILGNGRVFLVGEAAGFISRSSYEGIGNAMMSAASLAEAIVKTDDPLRRLRTYKRLTAGQRRATLMKNAKRFILFTQVTRKLIMKSRITALKTVKEKKK
jgi:flavin-dependent dehydrogenase